FCLILISSCIYADDTGNVNITTFQDGFMTTASSWNINPSVTASIDTPATTVTSFNTTGIANTTSSQTIASVTTSPTSQTYIGKSSTFTSHVTPTVSLSNNDNSNNYSPAYNATYGTPPPPLRTTITWSNVIFGIFFICVGLLEVFHGYKYIRITLLIMGYLFFSSTALIILLLLDNNLDNTRSATFYFTTWLLVGLIGGLLSFFCWHLGLMLTAAYGGYALSLSLLAILDLENHIIRWTLSIIVMILLAIIVHYFERTVIIFTTSIAGAYTVMYGVDEFAQQGFRDMIQLANADGFFRFNPTLGVYLMIAGVVWLAVVGIVYEYRAHESPIDHFCNHPRTPSLISSPSFPNDTQTCFPKLFGRKPKSKHFSLSPTMSANTPPPIFTSNHPITVTTTTTTTTNDDLVTNNATINNDPTTMEVLSV
ncbi:8117_t:CDS:2, partial [Ambispora leptoticha]